MRKFIILTVVGALVVAFGGLALVPSADAQELIHFDCIDDTNPETPDRPHTDQFNVPQNNLQCLPTGESVLGNGTVHPNLEIESPAGHFVVKNRAGAPAAATFGAPNDSTVNDNCFEFLDTGRVPITSGFGGWGFGDTSACAPGTCQNTPSKVELNFLFHDTTVSQFSVRMFDWTDFNPALGTDFQVTLTAYDALDAVVDTYSYHHTSTVAHAGNLVNPGPYDCVIEDGNSCFGGGLLSDLWVDGDACTAIDGEPGYLNLEVQGSGIVLVELRVPSPGFDSNVSFDSIRFTEDAGDPLPDDTNSYTQGYYGSSPKGEAEVYGLIVGDEAKCPEFNNILANVGEPTFNCATELLLLSEFLTGCVGPGKEKDLCIGFLPSGFEPGQNLAAQKITVWLNLNQDEPALESGFYINIDPVVDLVEGVPNGTIDPIITTNGELGSCTDSEPDGVCDDGTVELTLLGEKVTDLDDAGTTVGDILIGADALLASAGGDLTNFESLTEDVNGVTLSWDEMTDILGLINESFDKGVPTGFVTATDVD